MALEFLGTLGRGLLSGAKALGKGIATGAKTVGKGIANGSKTVGSKLSSGAETFGSKLANTSSSISSGIDDFVQGKAPSSGNFADTITGGTSADSLLTQEIDKYVNAPTESQDLTKFARALSQDDQTQYAPQVYNGFEPSMVDYSEYIYNNPYIQRMRGY